MLNKTDEAKIYLDEMLPLTRGKELRLIRLETFEGLRAVYLSKNDFKNALVYADSAYALKDIIYKEENIHKLNELEATYKLKEIKNKNALLAKENDLVINKDKTIRTGLLAAILFSMFLLIALYYFNKSNREAQKQASKISELSNIRDQYIKVIAHDIRSPIAAMHDMYDLLNGAIRLKKYDDLKKISNYIDETGVNTRRLLDNLLNWGMSQQEEVPYTPAKINLSNIIDEVISIYAQIKVIKGFGFTIENADGLWVYADIDGLKLILRNLIDNAVKNLPSIQGYIIISAAVDIASQNVIINIKNNGNGIDEEKLSTINQVFENPQTAQAGQHQLGLGTLLIGKFVKKNKGNIVAQSCPTQGSNFILTIPLA